MFLSRLLLLGIGLGQTSAHVEGDSYIAAVGHQLFGRDCEGDCDPLAFKLAALDHVEGFMQRAKEGGAQIIAFSEGVLGYNLSYAQIANPRLAEPIPERNEWGKANPCTNPNPKAPALAKASCLARLYKIVLVIDMGDRVRCSEYPGYSPQPCQQEGSWFFNTQVVLDESGFLLAKYHKTHPARTGPGQTSCAQDGCYPSRPNIVTFTTSFGVRFGLFLCFDLFFREPMLSEALDYGITDFIFSTNWESYRLLALPHTFQQAWSRVMGVNMIAANGGVTPQGVDTNTTGSGIYTKGQVLALAWDPLHPQERLLISRVPYLQSAAPSFVPGSPSPAPTPWMANASTRSIDVSTSPTGEFSVTAAGDFTCHVKFAVRPAGEHSSHNPEVYALSAFWGQTRDGVLPLRVCSWYRCPKGEACATYFDPAIQNTGDSAKYSLELAHFNLEKLELWGDFQPGDMVLPFLAGQIGALVPDNESAISEDRRGITVGALGTPLTMATLYAQAGHGLEKSGSSSTVLV